MDGLDDVEELVVEAEDVQRSTLLGKGVQLSTFPTRMGSSSGKPPLPVKKSVFKKPPHHA